MFFFTKTNQLFSCTCDDSILMHLPLKRTFRWQPQTSMRFRQCDSNVIRTTSCWPIWRTAMWWSLFQLAAKILVWRCKRPDHPHAEVGVLPELVVATCALSESLMKLFGNMNMLSGKNRDFHRQAYQSTVLANWKHEVSKGQGWG